MEDHNEIHREEDLRREDDDYRNHQQSERTFEDDDMSRGIHHQNDDHNGMGEEENFSIHITGDEIGFKLNEEALKSFFEKYGDVEKVSVIRDPATHASRKFGFVTMVRVEDAVRAVTEMEMGQIDGFEVKCQRAKRKQAYDKTPGQYLGPPGLSSKFIRDRRDRDRRRDRSRDRFDRRDRDRSRDRGGRDRSRDRAPPRDYDRGFDRGYDPRDRPPPMRDMRGFDPRDNRDPRGFDPRDFRGPPRYDMDPRGPPPPHFMDPRGPPPGYDMRAPRSPPQYGRGRSPPPMNRMDGPYDGGRAPPVANYAASSYYANAGNSNNGRNNQPHSRY